MADNRPVLFQIRESGTIPRELWDSFRATTQRRGATITGTLAGILRAYVERPDTDEERRAATTQPPPTH